MNALILTIALIFLPGIIWARLDAKFARQEKPTQFEFIINVFVFGMVSYCAAYLLYLLPFMSQVAAFSLAEIDLSDDELASSIQRTVVDEILVATGMSLILAPCWLRVQRGKWIVRFLQNVGATKRYGDEDVWDYLLSSDDPRTRYVNVRDDQTGQTFAGYVDMFSEAGGLRELVLSQVEGFETITGEKTISVARIYLARDPKVITLEFPATDANIIKNE